MVRYNGRDDRGPSRSGSTPTIKPGSIEVHRGDLKDHEAVRKAVEGRDWVFHLGALIAIPYSYQNPLDVVQTNVVGTAHVLDACRGLIRRWSGSSSPRPRRSTARRSSSRSPRSHPLRGQSPYAATKIGSDALGESYHRAFGLPVAILRPFNTFGPSASRPGRSSRRSSARP